MGIYCTITGGVSAIMIGTTFTDGSVMNALADKGITWAESEINKYLSKRYDVGALWTTTASTPTLLVSLSEQLAAGFIYKFNARGGKDAVQRGQDLIDPVLENLKMIAEYQLDLLDANGDRISDDSTKGLRALSNTEDYHDTFAEDDPLLWKIDSDKTDAIQDERD